MATGTICTPRLTLAGADGARTPLILSHLPKQGSQEYASLRAIAGDATGQALDMTKSEMWSVPSQNVEALKQAAARRGVEVTILDSNWNRTLTPMSSVSPMTDQQESMMKDTMGSKAVMGMSMTELPDSKVLEYALTKGMDDPTMDPATATLVIPLTQTKSITVRRTHVERTSDGCVWNGAIEGTGEPVSLMWWPAGRLTGQITYQGHVYMLKHMGGAMHGVVEMSPKAMPPEHAPMDLQTMKKMKMTTDPLVKEGDAGKLRGKARRDSRPTERELRNQQDVPTTVQPDRDLKRGPVTGPPRSDATEGSAPAAKLIEISLLVAYTKAAAKHYTSIEKDLVQLAVEQANQSFRASGIGHVRLKLVHTYRTSYVEKGSHFEHVFSFADKGDGRMEEVHRLRNKHKADIAMLIVDDANGCGLAAGVAPSADRAFAVVHHQCAALSYSLAHEIGHLIGARHDMALDDSKDPFPYGHGFVHGTEWRTMMSYAESCDNCPRLPVWSNPDVMMRGVAAGNEMANNARVIAESASRVAKFR
jgi:hypothetical protein